MAQAQPLIFSVILFCRWALRSTCISSRSSSSVNLQARMLIQLLVDTALSLLRDVLFDASPRLESVPCAWENYPQSTPLCARRGIRVTHAGTPEAKYVHIGFGYLAPLHPFVRYGSTCEPNGRPEHDTNIGTYLRWFSVRSSVVSVPNCLTPSKS